MRRVSPLTPGSLAARPPATGAAARAAPAEGAPGVYFDWAATRVAPFAALRTDVAGFVGIAERGPLHTAVKVESWSQFQAVFGGHIPQAYLAYAVEGFFANGGQTCWVVRAADPDSAAPATLELRDSTRRRMLRLLASSPGVWGQKVTVSVSRAGPTSFTLIVGTPDGVQEVWRNLTMNPDDPKTYFEKLLNDAQRGSRLVRAEVIVPRDRNGLLIPWPEPVPSPKAPNLQGGVGRLAGGRDGLAGLTLDHLTGRNAPAGQTWGLAALELVREISILALPDIMPTERVWPRRRPRPRRCHVLDEEPEAPPAPEDPPEFPRTFTADEIYELQAALVAQCETLKDRVAVLDPPPRSIQADSPEEVIRWRGRFGTKYAALYYPWLQVPDPLRLQGLLRAVPPSGHVAGVYARVDRQVGVHKPPANEPLEAAQDVTVALSDDAHGDLNDRDVNVLRAYPGRGLRVAGARSLASPEDPEWRFVNVRRLLIMIEEAIEAGAQWIVFEPNNPNLWREVERVVRGLLDGLWRRGMLDGATAEEAYTVACDQTTNPPSETDQGRLTCLIGVLPPWPAEFVVVRLDKTESGTEVVEEKGGRRG